MTSKDCRLLNGNSAKCRDSGCLLLKVCSFQARTPADSLHSKSYALHWPTKAGISWGAGPERTSAPHPAPAQGPGGISTPHMSPYFLSFLWTWNYPCDLMLTQGSPHASDTWLQLSILQTGAERWGACGPERKAGRWATAVMNHSFAEMASQQWAKSCSAVSPLCSDIKFNKWELIKIENETLDHAQVVLKRSVCSSSGHGCVTWSLLTEI